MNLKVAPKGTDLIDTLALLLDGEDKDYSKSLVVFPGKRPAHFLRRRLAELSASSIIPPRIYAIDEFIEFLSDTGSPVTSLEILDAVALLYDLHKQAENQIGGESFLTLDRFLPLGMKIFHDLEELKIEGIAVNRLTNIEAYLEEGMPKLTETRLQSLTWFYETFYLTVQSLGMTTRATRYRIALDQYRPEKLILFNQVVIAGFFALTDAEKRLFRALSALDKTLFVFQEGIGLAEKLKDLGVSFETPPATSPKQIISYYSAPDTHGEVMALGNELERRFQSGSAKAESSVILLPSSGTLFPLLQQGLMHLSEDSFNVSLGYPLFRTPVFGFLNALMELVTSMEGEKIYIPDYLKFILHPYTKNIFFRKNSEITRVLFHTLEEELLKKKARLFTSLSEIEENKEIFRESQKKISSSENQATESELREHLKWIHGSTIRPFLLFENIADFAKKGTKLLSFILHHSPARRHPLFIPFSDSLIQAFEALAHSRLKDFSFQERPSYFMFFRKFISTCHTPFPGTPLKGLQVLGALETRNLKFKSVFVLDANEEVFPDTQKEDSLIPFRAREILDLPTYLDRDQLTAYYFDLLLSGADDVHLFYIENQQKEKSRFVEKLLWDKEKMEKDTKKGHAVRAIQYRVDLENDEPRPILKNQEVTSFLKTCSFSATALDRYLKCPLRFYYATVLRLRPKEEMSVDVERNELGTFIHLLLAEYFRGKMGRPLIKTDLGQKEMERLIERHFEIQYGKDPTGALYLLRREIKRHLADFIDNYSLPLIQNNSITVLACEEKMTAEFESFKLSGRFDRIEIRDRKTVIIDYKTGSQPAYLKIDMNRLDLEKREEWSQSIGSLQLPFYLLLYSQKTGRPVEELEAIFLLLGRSRIGADIELPLFGKYPAAEIFNPLKTVILRLLEEITDSSLPFRPTADKKRNCPDCDYQTLCGTQWILK